MKTIRSNQKTENSSVKRMTVRAAVVVFSLIIISLTSSSAQELWAEIFNESNYGKMVELKARDASELKAVNNSVAVILNEADAKLNNATEAFTIETETDPELNVESWMISNSNFSSNESMLSVDPEPALEIEPWMTNASVFSSNAFTIPEEKDPELNVEEWMISNPNFSNAEVLLAPEAEPALNVEAWMIDSNNFKASADRTDKDPELNVESWMLDNQYFKNTEEKPLKLEAWMTDKNLWGL